MTIIDFKKILTFYKKIVCNWPYNWVFELQRPFVTSLQFNIFLQHECYQISYISYSKCNSLYMESYTYATHASQL
jgi:hypothetical protein